MQRAKPVDGLAETGLDGLRLIKNSSHTLLLINFSRQIFCAV